jgi:DNA repair protein RadC
MTVKTLPADARPREKLLARGAQALSDAELLALVLRTGTAGLGVLQLAEQVLQRFGGLAGLLQAPAAALAAQKGLGPAKRAELLAVLALAQRASVSLLKAQPVFDQPATLKQYVQLQWGALPHEVFAVLFLDAKQRLIASEELFRGSLNQATVYPREVAVRALAHHAASVVLVHNHPSGDLRASPADVALTRQLSGALGLLDVRVLDHIIVAASGASSLQEAGGW